MKKSLILLVEDELHIQALNRQFLEREGYTVLCADTLAEARRIIWETPVDLILLDVMLPDGSGYDFCAEIRPASDAPIIFLTCLGESDNIVEGLLRGGDDYISKPYDLGVLSSRIVAALRRSGKLRTGRIDLAPLSINLANDQVTLSGEPVALSRKEVQLLAFFASQPGREFSPEEIYEAVWGMAASNATRTVTVHVSSLRKKLGEPFEEAFSISFTSGKKYVFLRRLYMPED